MSLTSTKTNALFLSSLRDVAAQDGSDIHLSKKVLKTAEDHIETLENSRIAQRPEELRKFEDADIRISALFIAWGDALASQDSHRVAEISDTLDDYIKDHQFDYQQTKKLFYRYFHHSSYHEARKNYIECKRDDKNFGIVEKTVSDHAKIGIIGDWGTGTDDAKFLFQDMMKHRPEVVLHLGDIYESGLALEIEEFFLKPISDACKAADVEKPPVFTIPGNHEYFSGAQDYFNMLKFLNHDIDRKWAQKASFFCLRNKSNTWQFLGADTGLGCIDHPSSPRLESCEADWHRARIAEFQGKTVMMTHHQLVSAANGINHAPIDRHTDPNFKFYNRHLVEYFSKINPSTSQPYFDSINLWLWGHDHHFTSFVKDLEISRYEGGQMKNPVLRRGQLLGGSARETHDRGRVNPAVKDWVERRGKEKLGPDIDKSSGLTNHTYGILDLKTAQVTYYQSPAWVGNANPSPVQQPLSSYKI